MSPFPPNRKHLLLSRLKGIVERATDAQALTDLETVGGCLDDIEEELRQAVHLANTLEWDQ